MDRNINPLAATLVILISVVTFAVWFWSSGEAKKYGGPASLTVNPAGHLFIQIQNNLIEHDANGSFVARHDLEDIGVRLLLGGTDFFSNGDILLRRGSDTRSIVDTVRAFLRMTNDKSVVADTIETGLYRCNLTSKECGLFGEQAIDFRSAFSVFIDRDTDDVYISDSSRHLVRKYTSEGAEAADAVDGFKFPNQLLLHEGQLLIADTNHQRISAVHVEPETFGASYDNFDVVPSQAKANRHSWPSHFVRVGDEWWVNNMRNGMNYGGIYVFDRDWQFKQEVALPGKADPISLLAFNNEVLVSDWYGDRVHRVSTSGKALGDFTSPGLVAVLEESIVERKHFMLIAWLAVVIGVPLIISIVVKGTDWSRKTEASHSNSAPEQDAGPILLMPNPDNVKKLNASVRYFRWAIIPLLALVPVVIALSDNTQTSIGIILSSTGVAGTYFLVANLNRIFATSSILIEDNKATLSNHNAHRVQNSLSGVFYTDNIVTTGDIAVFLKQGQLPIYDHGEAMEALTQRLPATQRISHSEMRKKLMEMRHPIWLFGIAIVIATVLAALFFGARELIGL